MTRINIILFGIIFILSSCNTKKNIYEFYKERSKVLENINDLNKNDLSGLYKKNYINMNNGYPFYIIRMEAPLLYKKPHGEVLVPSGFYLLKYGDVVFPVNEKNPVKNYFYVKTIDGKYGWIHNGFGISINYKEDSNLYFFNEEYYLKFYKESGGNIDNQNKIILAKNVVPMLLGNFITPGWFYPEDYNLALDISKYSVSIVENVQTRFYGATVYYNWRYHDVLISYNLLADSYQKLKFLDKAEEIHDLIKKKYFWRSYDNSPLIGGLNSIVKLLKIYLEQLKDEKINSKKYSEIEEKIIENMLIVGDKYSVFPALDKDWPNLTFAEWLIDILRESVSRKEFYTFAKKLSMRTESEGFADMIKIYVAVEMYREGRQEEAVEILAKYKPKHRFKVILRIRDWLSINKIIPDSIIYQYNRF